MSTVQEPVKEVEVHEGRWGYHPCSYETCRKLKEAHLLVLRAHRDVRAWEKWDNKREPKGEAPKHPSFMKQHGHYLRSPGDDGGHYSRNLKKLRYGYLAAPAYWDMGLDGAQEHYYGQVLRAYQQARRPVENREDVRELIIPEDLWEMVEKLRGFYS